MPFIADSRAGVWNIQLNVSEICGEMETMFEKIYTEDIKEGSKFWLYVIQIETALNNCDKFPDFWEWFLDNYNNVEMWNEIQYLFEVEEDSDEEEEPKFKCSVCSVDMTDDLDEHDKNNMEVDFYCNLVCYNCKVKEYDDEE